LVMTADGIALHTQLVGLCGGRHGSRHRRSSRKNRQSGPAGHGGDCISRRGKPGGMRTRQPGPARGEAVMSAEHVVPLDAEHGAEAEAPPEARARALGRYHKWAVLALVAVGTFMTALDASIVNIGLPSIARAFRAPVGGAVEG